MRLEVAWHTHKTLGVVREGAVQHVCHTLSFAVTSGGGVQVRQCLDEWCVVVEWQKTVVNLCAECGQIGVELGSKCVQQGVCCEQRVMRDLRLRL